MESCGRSCGRAFGCFGALTGPSKRTGRAVRELDKHGARPWRGRTGWRRYNDRAGDAGRCTGFGQHGGRLLLSRGKNLGRQSFTGTAIAESTFDWSFIKKDDNTHRLWWRTAVRVLEGTQDLRLIGPSRRRTTKRTGSGAVLGSSDSRRTTKRTGQAGQARRTTLAG